MTEVVANNLATARLKNCREEEESLLREVESPATIVVEMVGGARLDRSTMTCGMLPRWSASLEEAHRCRKRVRTVKVAVGNGKKMASPAANMAASALVVGLGR